MIRFFIFLFAFVSVSAHAGSDCELFRKIRKPTNTASGFEFKIKNELYFEITGVGREYQDNYIYEVSNEKWAVSFSSGGSCLTILNRSSPYNRTYFSLKTAKVFCDQEACR